jgi:S-DNA-T family DNA segregation ATPase FtsK/SpoIIIE
MAKRLVGRGLLAYLFDALFSLVGLVIWWATKSLAQLAWWTGRQIVRHPRTSLGLGVLGGAVWLVGWEIVVGIVGLVLIAGSTWKAAHPQSFEDIVGEWLRHWWRRWHTYRQAWVRVMRRCGLAVEDQGQVHVPELRKIALDRYWDTLTVDVQEGQQPDDFRAAGERLRTAFGALRCTVREHQPAGVEISLMREDRLTAVVPAFPLPRSVEDVDLGAIPIGVDDRGTIVTMSLVNGHTAIMASSGAGKASPLWSSILGTTPAIAAGLVKPVFIDPKRRELRQGLGLVEVGRYGTKWVESGRSPYGMPAEPQTGDYAVTACDVTALLQRIVDDLDDANEAAGNLGERDFVPTLASPLRPIIIDELAPLLSLWPRTVRDRLQDLLAIILTQGRAAGYIVVAAIQEPTKDQFTLRDLFARRIAMRLPTSDHVEAALRERAADYGARAHEIPESLPGVGYAMSDGVAEYTRFRAAYPSNADIAAGVAWVEHLRDRARLREVARQDALAVQVDAVEVAA